MAALQVLLARMFTVCRCVQGGGKTPLASGPEIVQNTPVLKTTGTGFGDLCGSWRMNRRPMAVFHSLAMSPMGGNGGDTFGYAGTHERRFANPAICCPPSFGDGEGGSTAHGGHDMAALPIPTHFAHTFPQTEKAARRAARQWFAGTPTISLCAWRNQCCTEHCAGLPDDARRVDTFHEAFAEEMAAIIAAQSHLDVPATVFMHPERVEIRRSTYVDVLSGEETPSMLVIVSTRGDVPADLAAVIAGGRDE
jgi:hypothetical protein